jgi:hypothetical protein
MSLTWRASVFAGCGLGGAAGFGRATRVRGASETSAHFVPGLGGGGDVADNSVHISFLHLGGLDCI